MYALSLSGDDSQEPNIIHAKDPIVEELIDCCISIMGETFVRIFKEGHSKLEQKCLYCSSKNSEISAIYLRTEEREDLANCIKQKAETLLILTWNEDTKRYDIPSLLNLSCLSRIIAAGDGTPDQYQRYGSTIRSLLDRCSKKTIELRELTETDWSFLARAREVFAREEEM